MNILGGEEGSAFPALYRSFSEMEYQLPASFFTENEKYDIKEYLIIKMEGTKESTFLFEYYELSKGITHLVPEVNRYVDLPSKQFNQYYLKIVEMNTPDFKKASVELTITHEEAHHLKVRFFKCERE